MVFSTVCWSFNKRTNFGICIYTIRARWILSPSLILKDEGEPQRRLKHVATRTRNSEGPDREAYIEFACSSFRCVSTHTPSCETSRSRRLSGSPGRHFSIYSFNVTFYLRCVDLQQDADLLRLPFLHSFKCWSILIGFDFLHGSQHGGWTLTSTDTWRLISFIPSERSCSPYVTSMKSWFIAAGADLLLYNFNIILSPPWRGECLLQMLIFFKLSFSLCLHGNRADLPTTLYHYFLSYLISIQFV